MIPLLTDEQLQALETQADSPLRLFDPVKNRTYVLLPAEVYERARAVFERNEFDIREAYPLMDDVARKAGWDDPAMDIYDVLD